jgi:Ras-related protein R-Ras2
VTDYDPTIEDSYTKQCVIDDKVKSATSVAKHCKLEFGTALQKKLQTQYIVASNLLFQHTFSKNTQLHFKA